MASIADIAVEIYFDGTIIKFKEGGHITNGDVHAGPGNKIEFFSAYPFAVLFKGQIKFPARPKKAPYSLKFVPAKSPAEYDQAAFGSELKTGSQRVFIKLKDHGLNHNDMYPYAVAILDPNDWGVKLKDPQIIIQ